MKTTKKTDIPENKDLKTPLHWLFVEKNFTFTFLLINFRDHGDDAKQFVIIWLLCGKPSFF